MGSSREDIRAYDLRRATEAAALAACGWIGRGDKTQVDVAAITAMAAEIEAMGIDGRVVVLGEAPRADASALHENRRFGDPDRPARYDIAVDPVEGTTFLAKGMTNALAAIALSPAGTMMDPAPCFYMEKLAVPPAAARRVDPAAPVEARLEQLAAALGKRVSELTVYVLEKPRHRPLVARIQAAGAKVALYPAGDVAGALMAAMPESGIDALMGTGGAPEGILSAAAIRLLGGDFYARLDPQLVTERQACADAGLDCARWWRADELVRSDQVIFCATGITTGLLMEGVTPRAGGVTTQTLMAGGGAGRHQILTAWHARQDVAA